MENLRQVQVTTEERSRIFENGVHKGKFKEPTYELGIFHKWEDFKDGDFSEVRAVVEFEDGSVQSLKKHLIKFTNRQIGSNMFEEGIENE